MEPYVKAAFEKNPERIVTTYVASLDLSDFEEDKPITIKVQIFG